MELTAGRPTAEEELVAAGRIGLLGGGWRVRKYGSRFWAHVTVSAVRNGGGSFAQLAEVTRDLTERTFGGRAVAGQPIGANEANRVKGDFLATMSHELCHPADLPARLRLATVHAPEAGQWPCMGSVKGRGATSAGIRSI